MEIFLTPQLIDSCLAASKSAYPNEFLGLVEGELKKQGKKRLVLNRLVIPPSLYVSPSMSSYSEWMMPTLMGIWGTFHSHPGTFTPRPSSQDKRLFSKKGGIHLIASEPFNRESLAAFDVNGRRVGWKELNEQML